jgi:MFS family permease
MNPEADRRVPRGVGPAVLLLGFAILINYVDRGNLSVAAPMLKDELQISASQLGVLFSAFFWTYTALQIPSGWLVDRFDANRAIAVGFLVWSLATAATGLARGFAMLLGARLLLGVGECVAFPACSKILARHVPEHSRGIANAIIIAGLASGPAVGTLAGGILMARYGWRPVFMGIGLVSLLWLPLWITWMPRGAGPAIPETAAPPLAAIARQRSFWGAAGGHFCGNYVVYFLVTWLPFYLVRERGLSMTEMAPTAALCYFCYAAAATLCGAVTDLCVRRGYCLTVVRKAAMGIGYGTSAFALMGCAFAQGALFTACLALAGASAGTGASGTFAFSQTLAGPRAAGKWTGLQNFLANFAGVIGPALTGLIVDWTGHFLWAFVTTAAFALCGAISWMAVVGELVEVRWTSPGTLAEAASDGG